MRKLTSLQIEQYAVNTAAAQNGRKISQKNSFFRRERSADDTFYSGLCTGSGSAYYSSSVDFSEDPPVFRCSCPSRQIPCKHCLGLLYDILAGKDFAEAPIPEDILKKRERRTRRTAAAAGEGAEGQEDGSSKPAKAPKTNTAARTKKLKKQLEGLDLLDKLLGNLVNAGLGSMGGTALGEYRDLSKQLGDYYLPGPQGLLNSLILEIGEYQRDSREEHLDSAVRCLEQLRSLSKKARGYLSGKVDSGEVSPDESTLYEALGGAWRLDELEALGLVRHNARLAQLAFWILEDRAREQYVDTGCWADLDTGEIHLTRNYRPYKALRHVKAADSVFELMHIPSLMLYPGEGNRRVRWDSAEPAPFRAEDWETLRGRAAPALAPELKTVRNLLRDPLADPMVLRLLRYQRLGKAGDTLVLQDPEGGTIALGDMPGMDPTAETLALLPDAGLLEEQVLLGGFWMDSAAHRLMLQPLSIVTQAGVVRLLY